MSQTVEPGSPGFYTERIRRAKKPKQLHEDRTYQQALARLSALGASPFELQTEELIAEPPTEHSICDRCHDLLHQSRGQSILHPSMESIRSIIEESPHRHNHIYHVLDAADFPLSLIPNLMTSLDLPRMRTQNRRSKSRHYIARDRVADVSFIVTRSDLLAPQKEQVDRMMPYLQDVLRDALGRTGRNVRLGNLRCVSAKRGWWTTTVKQEIWDRGGAGWVVGKVNVGKSALFEVVFPKGRLTVEDARLKNFRENGPSADEVESTNLADAVVSEAQSATLSAQHSGGAEAERPGGAFDRAGIFDSKPKSDIGSCSQSAAPDEELDMDEQGDGEISLLPPAQVETQYPRMPIVSALPGTTASPIRIPFGSGKGELIDLPGVRRSSLETHVQPEHHSSLVMKSRVTPQQYTIKPGQSLLIGGIVRITPKTDDLVYLAYPFVPLQAHATGTQKAIAIQTGVHEDSKPYAGDVENIGTATAKQRIKSAGTFALAWDVTKKRTGPVTDKVAGKQKPDTLPYVVYGADVLIEGVGWVELVCQVRKRKRNGPGADALSADFGDETHPDDAPSDSACPEVEVWTPKGKFIAVRKPMNAWLVGGPKKLPKHKQRKRPRMSMSMHRRREGGKKSAHATNGVAA